jgi:predicted flap endonuclease-1-like 5' DNA nuclease
MYQVDIPGPELRDILSDLGIPGQPVYKAVRHDDDTVEIETRDGTFTWTPVPDGPATLDGNEDLTAIPGIGPATAQDLTDAGIRNFHDLVTANDAILVDLIGEARTQNIRVYLRDHYL